MTDEQPPPKSDFQVEPGDTFCPVHGEPYRKLWPQGAIIATVQLWHWFMQRESLPDEVAAFAKSRGIEHEGDAYVPALNAYMKNARPCCKVGRKRMIELYLEGNISTVARCRQCRRKRHGTEVMGSNADGSTFTVDHMCFECVCDASERQM